MRQYDLVIRNGIVHDGLGTPGRKADVAVNGGLIVAIGAVEGAGTEEIDAAGMLVTPGFIDPHTHYDGQATWENRLVPSSIHGVTTVVTGNCGVGFAPCRPDQHDTLVSVMEGVEDVPEVVMAEGLPWNWESFPEYLDALEARHYDVDIATQLPHSALRVYVMGERAVRHEPPLPDDLAQMRRLTTEAIGAGAIGVSTSRNMLHRTRAGELAPSLFSEGDELEALALGLRDAGGGVFQIIPHISHAVDEEFPLLRRLATAAERPLSYSLLQMPGGAEDRWQVYLDETARAQADGLKIRAQVAPRPVGMLYGLDLSFHPFSLHPSFRPLLDLPLAEKVARMRDPALRARLLAEEAQDTNPVSLDTVRKCKYAYPMGREPNYEPDLADRIDKRAAEMGVSVNEYLYDLLLEDEGRMILYLPGANYRDGNLDAVWGMLTHPDAVVGLGDGGAHYGMICDASFPTYFLIRWVRDGADGQRIALPEAIAALTSKPADMVGLTDRGRLVVGAKGDINIIDLDALALEAPAVARDLPGDGRRLHQRARGYAASIVSGTVTYRHGEPTGALPGRLVRGRAA